MTYGLVVYAPDGVTEIFNSRSAQVGCATDIVTATSAAQTFTYPLFAGRNAEAIYLAGYGATASVDTALGYPRVTISALSAAPSPASTFLIVIT